MPQVRGVRRSASILAVTALVLAGLVGVGVAPASAAVTPVTNPPIADQCGVDVTLVLDASGSVQTSGAVNQVRDAAEAFLDSLSNTGSTARVTQFATVSQQLAPATVVDDATLGTGGVLRGAIEGYYNPRPPRPAGVDFIKTNGQVDNSSNNNQYTNWDGSLNQAAQTTPNLVVYVTDGDPTAYDLDKAGDPGSPGPPPDVRFGTSSTDQTTLDRAVEEANRVKTQKSRMLAVGVGSALSNSGSQQRLVQIAGPQIVRDADLQTITSLNQVDVALVTKFENLAAFLRSVVLQLCSPSLTIQKLAQTADDATYAPAQGWDMTVTPRALPPGTGFNWVLPDTTTATSKTVATNSGGLAQFQWEPIPGEASSAATVTETLQPGYAAGRPGANNDFTCELKNEDGNVRTVAGELDLSNPAAPTFELNPIGQEIVTCKVYNSFDYTPAINVTKVNNPTSLRGDLTPPATVTSSYVVTNPGNTPLSNIDVQDDVCGAATPVPTSGNNAGDTNRDGLLQPGESWQFTCTHPVVSRPPINPAGLTIPNTVTATGIPPNGGIVSDTAVATVTAWNPGIQVVKRVNGQDLVTVASGTQVTYTYEVSNAGNTPLSPVTLADDTAPCQVPTRGPDNPGNDDAVLGLTEVWTYTCNAVVTQAVANIATATGTPIDPTTNVPFPTPNPPVTDVDPAAVEIVNPDIVLTKTADPNLLLLPEDGSPQPVTYSYTATNPGDAPLGRPATNPGGTKDPGWVTDNKCSPVTYVDDGGDANTNNLLDPGEAWHFICTHTVGTLTVNQATIAGQPSDAAGVPLPGIGPVTDNAVAIVAVVVPGIDIVKTAVRDVVLDPDANPVAGPDFPTPRPASYTYEVHNTGDVPLVLTPDPPTDDICGPLRGVPPTGNNSGDTNGNGRLDITEVWHYTCTTPLQRQQGTPPPTGPQSGLVTNTVHVTGVPFFDGAEVPDKAVSASDQAQVTVIEPGISITKAANPTGVRAGREVTYTFVVTNTGDVGLENVVPTDDKCAPLVRTGGDTNGDDILEGANAGTPESWTYTCTRAIGMPDDGTNTDTNTVTVSGVDPLGNTYVDDATAVVRVIDPAIHLDKSVSQDLVPVGTTVTYTFEATNVGSTPVAADDVLDTVLLRDAAVPANPGCRQPVLVAKEGGNQDAFLDRVPAETWRYTCQGTITKTTVDVAAVGALGGRTIGARIPVADFATAQVTAFHPGVSVEKTATPEAIVGSGEVTYTYAVRNTGDVPLAGVQESITDDTCSPVQYASGDLDGDGLLDSPTSIFEDALDETWLFTCTTVVDEDTTNTVVVPATPVDPGGNALCDPAPASTAGRAAAVLVASTCDVSATDTATVTVTPAVPPLPDTGVSDSTVPIAETGALLLLLGAGLVWWSSRSRRRTSA